MTDSVDRSKSIYVASAKIVLLKDTPVILRIITPKGELESSIILKAGTKITLLSNVTLSQLYGFTIDIIMPYIVPAQDTEMKWYVEKEILDTFQQKSFLMIPVSSN